MNIATIKKFDIANGPGVRVSIFVSGCRHACKNCFNKEAWDFNYGFKFTPQVKEDIFESLNKSYIAGLSLLGGEPFEPENQKGLVPFLEEFKKKFPNKNVWCYTGYTFEKDLLNKSDNTEKNYKSRAFCKFTPKMLEFIDVLVDGEFVEDLKNIRLKFRGSENHRIIDVKQSLAQNETVLVKEYI